jgi:hypothetical protein
MQAVLNLVWERLLPAMKASPLPVDRAAQEKLSERLASLTVRPATGRYASPLAAVLSGKRFEFAQHPRGIEAITFEFAGENPSLTVRTVTGESRIVCGAGQWQRGLSSFVNGMEGRMVGPGEHKIAATGAWTTDNAFAVKLCLYETPFYVKLSFQFEGDEVRFDSEYNAAFGPTTQPQLVGRAR